MGTLTPTFGSIKPSQSQQLLQTNYLQFNTGTGKDFAQQYLPEIYEQEVERYGNRTLSGFLRMVGQNKIVCILHMMHVLTQAELILLEFQLEVLLSTEL